MTEIQPVADFFTEANEASAQGNPYFKAEVVGDFCRGYLIKKRTQKNDLKLDEEVYQRIYTIEVPEGESYKAHTKEGVVTVNGGELMDVYGRATVDSEGKRVAIIIGLDSAPLGGLIGFKFTEQRKPSKPGFNGAKIVTGYWSGVIREDIVKKNAEAEMTPISSEAPF